MAIATLKEPFKDFHGSLSKEDKYYVRMYRGQCVLQHKPQKCLEKQRLMREAFGRDWGTARKKPAPG